MADKEIIGEEMSKNYLKTYLTGLKIIGVLLSFAIPIVIYISLISSILWVDISLQRFALKQPTPSITAEKSPPSTDKTNPFDDIIPGNLRPLTDRDIEQFDKQKLILDFSWDNSRILSWISFYVLIPFCFALYFPIFKFATKSLRKSFKELRNE